MSEFYTEYTSVIDFGLTFTFKVIYAIQISVKLKNVYFVQYFELIKSKSFSIFRFELGYQDISFEVLYIYSFVLN